MIDMEMVLLECPKPECGVRTLISNPREGMDIKCGCGEEFMLTREPEHSSPSLLAPVFIFVSSVVASLLGAYITDTLPTPDKPRDVRSSETRSLVGGVITGLAVGYGTYAFSR